MTERIRQLLDDAVAELEPALPDPVGALIRRGRSARRRRTAAALAAATAVLVGGGFAVRGLAAGGDGGSPAIDAAADQPPIPHVVGDMVVAGALELPIPAGWRVVTADAGQPCAGLSKTILLITSDRHVCQYAAVEVSPSRDRNPGGIEVETSKGSKPGAPQLSQVGLTEPAPVTLHGGEPGWSLYPIGSGVPQPNRFQQLTNDNTLLLPWSMVSVTLRQEGAAQQQIVDSMRSSPTAARPLVLPSTAAVAELTVPDADGQISSAGRHRSISLTTVAAVLRLLGDQTAVVPNAEACAAPDQRSLRLVFSATDGSARRSIPLNEVTPSPATTPSRTTTPLRTFQAPTETPQDTTVVIALGDGGCQEAVSSDGGRVRLSDTTVVELEHLFGIGVR